MDPYHPAKHQRPASARQRRKAISDSARMRHTQQSSGGGVSTEQRANADDTPQDSGADTFAGAAVASALRERIHSGALVTASVVSERMRRVSQFTRKAVDPLERPSAWIIEPSWYEHLHNWLADTMPFQWRERARSHGFWRKRALPAFAIVACLALAIGVGVFALNTAGRAAGALSTNSAAAQATTGSSVMISPYNNGLPSSPTPVAEQYDVGVWVSDTLPQGGSVTVFVRVSNYTQPVPYARVYIHASTPNGGINIGPLTTDAYGLASARLNYGNVGSQRPIYLTGTTTINGQKITGQYTFVTF